MHGRDWVCLPWNAARTARSSGCAACTTSSRRRCSRCVRGVGLDLEVTEGGRETLKGGELVGIDLCHAAKVPIADELGRRVGWVEARSARRSVRGGQNLSARRVGQQQNLTGRHPLHDPRTPYLSRYARFGVACSPSMVEDGRCGGGFGGPRSRAPGLVGTRGLAIFPAQGPPRSTWRYSARQERTGWTTTWGTEMRSCSWSVLVQETAEQVASVDPGLRVAADEGHSSGWIRRLKLQRPVGAMSVVVRDDTLRVRSRCPRPTTGNQSRHSARTVPIHRCA
jgi:hypothetical protein